MNLLQRINTGLSLSILVVCVLLFAAFGWSGTGWKTLAIPTGSMRPDIPPGSLVLVHSVPVTSLRIGDVITHIDTNNPKITISHRIIKIYKQNGKVRTFITKGDANRVADKPVVEGEIMGKVVWHAPFIGRAVLGAKNPWLILPIIYAATILICAEEVQRLAEYYRRFVLYRLPMYRQRLAPTHSIKIAKRASLGAALTTAFVVAGLAIAPSALAALQSNTVSLTDNRITVASTQKPPVCKDHKYHKYYYGKHYYYKCDDSVCDGDHDSDDKNCHTKCVNNVNVSNTTTQSATTGNAHSNDAGNASSGNAINVNSSNIKIKMSNC
jgi:signal peptidase I